MKNEFMKIFKQLTYRHQNYEVWHNFIYMCASSIANRFDQTHYDEREKTYLTIISKYDQKEQTLFPKLFAIVIEALEKNPEQDFLGELFMNLELGSHWKGQFFTPYHVSRLMAEVQMIDIHQLIKSKGYVTVNDPACGAGALLIAFSNAVKAQKINYQKHVHFVAQDIDETAALMCYIQLSLLGCSGYVVIGNSLTEPLTEDECHRNVWYTPLYFSKDWHWRRVIKSLESITKASKKIKGDSVQVVVASAETDLEQSINPIQLTLF